GPLDHPSVEAKSEGDFVLGANLAGQRNDLAFHALLDGDGPNRPGHGGGRIRLVASGDGRGDQESRGDSRREHRGCSPWSASGGKNGRSRRGLSRELFGLALYRAMYRNALNSARGNFHGNAQWLDRGRFEGAA